MPHIICFHLFNDFSGSPKVLKLVLEGLLKKGYQVDLVSSNGGALNELLHYKSLRMHSYSYQFSNNPVITMLRYSVVQLYTFLFAFRWLFTKDVVFYINTLLPVGPALAGRIMRKRVIYHYHENAFIKGGFYKILCKIMQLLATDIICVSEYQRSFLTRKKNVKIIPNALPTDFMERLVFAPEDAFERKCVLMLGSLKLYKGTLEFIELAKQLPLYSFELVINDTMEQIESFKQKYGVSELKNLTIYPRQNDVVPFYNKASIVLNLSNKKKILETFGLTVIEAMAAGLPVIVPTEGGIAELVEDGVNGYHIDVQELDKMKEFINVILSNKELYFSLAESAKEKSHAFDEESMITHVSQVIGNRL